MKMIVAADENWAIGYGNELLAFLPKDLQHFKKITEGHIVVMGRKTLESLPKGKPLKDRTNIVITRDREFQQEGVIAVNSIDKLKAELFLLQIVNGLEVFIIGGASIYKQFLEDADEIYVTKMKHKFEKADAFFPNLDEMDDWELAEESEIQNEGGLEYTFAIYKRKTEEIRKHGQMNIENKNVYKMKK